MFVPFIRLLIQQYSATTVSLGLRMVIYACGFVICALTTAYENKTWLGPGSSQLDGKCDENTSSLCCALRRVLAYSVAASSRSYRAG